ncbi:MAG: hypothetical protein K2I81_01625 [Alphaproteobacteria bacterium]|nr:hypothetical protein [Alphaproteobacteria bacterium]
MNKFLIFAMLVITGPAFAMNETANMLRRCEGVNVTNSDNYILRCSPDDKITKTMERGVEQFFSADNDGDVRGSFLDAVPDNKDFIYVNVIRNSPDSRYADQICYRFIKEKDASRDGYYAVEVCEYERADYYL